MIRNRWSLCLPFALLAACGKGPATTAIITRDSAGVTIIEHPEAAIAAAPLWTAGAPTVTITHGATEDQTFSSINFGARLADGRILVIDSDNQGSTVSLFAADGKFERRLGGPGAGPGEFMAARLMSATGDTLVFYDARSSRVTRMLTTGTLVDTEDLARLGMMTIGFPAGVLADGRMVTTPFVFGDSAQDGKTRYRQRSPIITIDAAALRADTVNRTIPGNEVYLSISTFGGQSRSFPAPLGYGRRTLLAPLGAEIHVAANETSALDTYTLPWTLRRSVRFAGARVAVDEEAREAVRAAAIAQVERMGAAAGAMKEPMLDMIKKGEIADSMAWYQGITAGADGSIWLREMRTVSDSVPHYLVVGADGKLVARVDLPHGSRLLWADADQLLISLTDADDVPHVELRPITKGAAQ